VANIILKVCAWGWHWHAALKKFGLAQDGSAAATAEQLKVAMSSGPKPATLRNLEGNFGSKGVTSATYGKNELLEESSSFAVCKLIRVLGHGPCDMQSAPILFLPVASAPTSLRRQLAATDETVCFFMTWSGSLSDHWHDEASIQLCV
jgi:hypothetical protein